MLVLGHASSNDGFGGCWRLLGHKVAEAAARDESETPALSQVSTLDNSSVSFGGSTLRGWKRLASRLQVDLRPLFLCSVVFRSIHSFSGCFMCETVLCIGNTTDHAQQTSLAKVIFYDGRV